MEINSVSISEKRLIHSSKHMHSDWEIIFNLEGRGKYIIDEKECYFEPGDIFICPPKTYHEKKSSDAGFQDLFINFSDEYLLSTKEPTFIKDDITGTLKELFIMAYKIFSAQENGYIHITEKIIELILTVISHRKDCDTISECTSILKNMILDSFSNAEFSCFKAMNDIPYNNDYIRRCFKHDMGMTPTKYLYKIRLSHAMNLLKQNTTPNIPISEIAMRSGFYDVRYFSRKFRKEFGITASDARS